MAVILLIDDRAVNRQFLATLLAYAGHRTVEAADGAEGLAAVQAERPDLVITDILMPVMDGLEFVRRPVGRRRATPPPPLRHPRLRHAGRPTA